MPSTKKRHTVKRHSKSTAGRIMPPLDVRSKSEMADFVKRVTSGPLTIIMVYADWCGHCHEMMPHFDTASKNSGRSIQSVKMNETMVNQMNNTINKSINSSAPPIKVDGYPSILLMDQNGQKVSDISPIKSTEAMEKVMNMGGPLAEKAGLSNTGPASAGLANAEPENDFSNMSAEEKEARAASALESPLSTVSPPQETPTAVGGSKHDKKGLFHAMKRTPYHLAPSGALFSTIRRMMTKRTKSKKSKTHKKQSKRQHK